MRNPEKVEKQSVRDIESYWTELLYRMSEGDMSNYEVLKGMEVKEFFRLYNVFLKNEKQKANGKNRN
jgi:hypothetical protein